MYSTSQIYSVNYPTALQLAGLPLFVADINPTIIKAHGHTRFKLPIIIFLQQTFFVLKDYILRIIETWSKG